MACIPNTRNAGSTLKFQNTLDGEAEKWHARAMAPQIRTETQYGCMYSRSCYANIYIGPHGTKRGQGTRWASGGSRGGLIYILHR